MTFLRPVAMVKVGLLGLKSDRPAILSALHDLGAVQVEPIRKEALAELEAEPGGEAHRKVAEELLRFRTLKNALPPRPPAPIGFASLEELLAGAAAVRIDAEVTELKREEDRLLTERKQLVDTSELLSRHQYCTVPLEQLRAKSVLAFFGEAPAEGFAPLQREISAIAETAFSSHPEGKSVRFVVAVPTANADAVSRIAQQAGVKLAPVPDLKGRIAEELPRLAARLLEVDRRLGELRAGLADIARVNYSLVAAIEEALAIENRKFETYSRMASGHEVFAVDGWIPQRSVPALEQLLTRVAADRALLYPIPTSEEAPTLIENPRGIRRFEFFIRFYAIPKSNEFDPTWIFALAFPIFFGFMLGDWGYGLVILLVSLWMIAGFPGGGRLPHFITSLPKLIMSPPAMRTLAWTLLPGCVIAIGLGVYFNELFGFQLPYTAFAVPQRSVGKLLVIAGYIGLVMVVVGFALGALLAYYQHHPKLVLMRIGGILFAIGVAFAGLTVIHAGGINGHSPTLLAFIGVSLAGLACMFVAEGGRALLGLIEVVSHILSYTRLVGILLASVILASVIDMESWTATHNGTILGLVAGLVMLIFGQVFVLILAVFEPGIQGARLIFVEQFSKFYEGNGRPFLPFRSSRTFTTAAPSPASAPVR
ncbi:MAG: V-type ATP synthase subunit I [Thermoplasmata archaeon]|nr:V-type ATP synthase subunit I [Thermoplasmata archaeon]